MYNKDLGENPWIIFSPNLTNGGMMTTSWSLSRVPRLLSFSSLRHHWKSTEHKTLGPSLAQRSDWERRMAGTRNKELIKIWENDPQRIGPSVPISRAWDTFTIHQEKVTSGHGPSIVMTDTVHLENSDVASFTNLGSWENVQLFEDYTANPIHGHLSETTGVFTSASSGGYQGPPPTVENSLSQSDSGHFPSSLDLTEDDPQTQKAEVSLYHFRRQRLRIYCSSQKSSLRPRRPSRTSWRRW